MDIDWDCYYRERWQVSSLEPLYDAIDRGERPYAMLKEYGGELSIDQRDEEDMTVLRYANKAGNLKAIQVLIEMGADFVSSYQRSRNALYTTIYAAPYDKREEILRLLLDYNCINVACCQYEGNQRNQVYSIHYNVIQALVTNMSFEPDYTFSFFVDLLCNHGAPLPTHANAGARTFIGDDPSASFVLSFLTKLPSSDYTNNVAVASFLHVMLAFFPLKELLSLHITPTSTYSYRNNSYYSNVVFSNQGDSLLRLACMKGVTSIVKQLLLLPYYTCTLSLKVDKDEEKEAYLEVEKDIFAVYEEDESSTLLSQAKAQGYTEIARLIKEAMEE